MRVLMGEVIDVNTDLTTKHLSIKQKIAVLWQVMIAGSKILGNRKKVEAEKLLKERNTRIDNLRDGVLANLEFHLTSNRTLSEYNEEAKSVQLAIARTDSDVLDEVLAGHEFNSFDWEEIALDPDMVNSFGNHIPIVISFVQKEA